jgi:hypothetical protein
MRAIKLDLPAPQCFEKLGAGFKDNLLAVN